MKTYEEYKVSGVKWLGKVPKHWEICRFKDFISLQTQTSLSENKIGLENIECATGKFIETNSEFEGNGIAFDVGDVIYGKLRPYLKKVWLSTFNGNAVGDFFVFRAKNTNSASYIRYVMLSDGFTKEADGSTFGTKMPRVSSNFIMSMRYFLPPPFEQQAIADYLDAKTEKMDQMIAKAEKKIEYLGELKQSLITRAVTRGLNPNAPLKDSGVKWIGKVPEHWEIMPFKYYGKLCKGLTFSKADLTATGVPVMSYGQIHSKENKSVRFFEEGIRFIPRELTKNGDSALVKQGDFIFADTSEDLEGCGNCVYNDTTNPIYAGYHTIIYKTRERDCKYLAYLFRSNVWRSQIRCRVSGIKVYSITQGIMSQVNILLPPMSEQKEISTYLDIKCSKIDHIVATQKKKIAYLQELKQSLITNVVTGKIKVS